MAQSRQIVVDLVSDERDYVRSMQRSAKATQETGDAMGALGSAAESQGKSMADIGEAFDDAEKPVIGMADLMDGLATTMGLDGLSAAVSYTRGIGDMASGIGNGLLPVLSQGREKVKGLSAAFLASPSAKYKVGLGVAAAATVYLANETGNLEKAIGGLKFGFKGALDFVDTMAGKLLGVFGAANQVGASLEALKEQGKELSGLDALSPKGGGVDISDWYGSEGMDWAGRIRIQQDIARDRQAAAEKAVAAASRAANAASTAASKAESAAEKAAKEADKKLNDRFKKVESTLDRALKSWQDKVKNAKQVRDGFRDLFELKVDSDPTAEGGLVARLRKQAADMEKFVKVIARLRKMGFREELVRDLVDRGPEALADATELSHVSVKDTNRVVDSVKNLRNGFADDEAKRRTGTDPNSKGVKVTLDVKGSDKALVALIKKWVKEEGGGDVQVAFGGKK